MIRVALGGPPLRLRVAAGAVEGIEVGALFAPSEQDGAARVYFSPHNIDRYVSAIDVLEGRVDPAQLRQKLVLIGVTGVGIDDKHTPLGVPMPGVEIHAQLLENLYDGTLLTRPSWAPRVEALAFLLLGTILAVATARWKPQYAACGRSAAWPRCWLPDSLSFRAQRLLFDAHPNPPRAGARAALLHAVRAHGPGATAEEIARATGAGATRTDARMAGELRCGQTDPDRDPAARRLSARRSARRPRGDDDRPRARSAATCTISSGSPARAVLPGRGCRRKGLSASHLHGGSSVVQEHDADGPGRGYRRIMSRERGSLARQPGNAVRHRLAGILDLESGELAYCNAGTKTRYLLHRPTRRCTAQDGGDRHCARSTISPIGSTLPDAPGEQLCVVSDASPRPGGLRATCRRQRVGEMLVGLAQRPLDARGSSTRCARTGSVRRRRRARGRPHGAVVLRWNGPGAAAATARG